MQEELMTGDQYGAQHLPGLSGGGSGGGGAVFSGGYAGRPGDADAVLAGLDPEQRAVATALHGPVCVLAGAGTGKTRAITHRIAYGVRSGVFQPQQVMAVTFTARAAGEMRGRLRELGAEGVQARTFHSAALRQLQYFWPRVVGGEVPRLLERKVQLVAEAAGRTGLRVQRTELRDLTSEIEWAKVTQIVPDDYPVAVLKSGRDAPRDPAEIARVYATYEQTKRDRNVIDFEDVLLLTAAILEDRPEIADRVRAQYRHFTVDEYQDVSPLQQRLLDQWTGAGASLCVVGDASQTIYSFTGATPDYLLNFRHKHPDATVVKLVRDYRSTPQVVHLANGLLAQARGEAARHRLELVSQRAAGPEPVYTEYVDEPSEAESTAHRIKELLAKAPGQGGYRASEIAVLFRTNGQSEVYEQALADLGISYQLKGAERFFERPEVREAGLLLRGAARAGNDPLTADAPDLAAEVRAVLGTRGFTATPPAGSGAVRERWESLAALVRLAEEFEAGRRAAGEPADLAAYVGELDARAAAQHAPAVEGVTLASLHAAKGLEWDAVFLVGLTEGTLPIIYAKTDEQLEEERRLLYVGVTRAREHLSLSWALSRSPGGRASRKPTRFLDGLRPGSGPAGARSGAGGRGGVEGGGGERAAGRKARGPVKCRVCDRTLTDAVERKLRRCEDCPSSMDEALYERLRAWRAGQAKKQGAPAYVVFTDATLMAIAEDVPADTRALAQISGVGAMKLDKYGAAVLSLCAGEEPEEEPVADADGPSDEPSEEELPQDS
ncbi:DNA helicase-2/ATP-dependent DNA helicase PcrA [Kitasatospora sp. MAP12-15]|uniref:ATP-dependent DNA helicase UvrD2 n=1 Tax=unclassified Kitasatospora TaxID=2633591 RepID=UPI002473F804|nr:ATP-dependent DNA helicase UvrD2 [Kitasatospora sp. MAP12-44]MDH6112694.1 DNA helicase-2/ATP-dependent DNA helicase PcrA [Kitasatospora sp. MAP12-44]